MFRSGKNSFKVLAPTALDSSNEEEILLSLYHLLRGLGSGVHLRLYHALSLERIRLAPIAGESFLHQITLAQQAAEEKLRAYTEALRAELPPEIGVDFHVERHEMTAPAEEILRHLSEENFSLLVLTFKQRKRWEKFFGMTALWDLIEEATTPILLLPAPLTIPPRRILWVSSMSSDTFPKLAPLIWLIRQLRGTLYCAKINTPTSFTTQRTFQRQVLDLCDYIIDHIDPDFVPEECLLYNDRDTSEGTLHVAQDFLMDVVALDVEEAMEEWKSVERLLNEQLPVLLLRK